MKEIHLEFDEEGNIKVEAKGYQGNSCEYATKPFEDLFNEKKSKEYKQEYKNRSPETNKNTIRNRV